MSLLTAEWANRKLRGITRSTFDTAESERIEFPETPRSLVLPCLPSPLAPPTL